MRLRCNILIFIFVLPYVYGHAQTKSDIDEFSIQYVTQDDGLSQASNYFRFEDSKGFMWITANDAVNRYDGSYIKVYNLEKYFRNCPPLQQGYGFAEDDAGNVYIGSDHGLYRYNRRNDNFNLLRMIAGGDSVLMPIAYQAGKIWCFNRYWQIITFDPVNQNMKIVATLQLEKISAIQIYASLSSVFYWRYPVMDRAGNIWLFSNSNFGCYNIYNGSVEYPLPNSFRSKLTQIHASCYDSVSNSIFIDIDHQILQYIIPSGEIRLGDDWVHHTKMGVHQIYHNQDAGVSNQEVQKLGWLRQGESILSKSEFYHRITLLYGGNPVDKSGKVWIEIDGQGQFILDPNPKILPKKPCHSFFDTIAKIGGVQTFGELPNGDILVNEAILHNKTKTIGPLPKMFFEFRDYRKATDPTRKEVWCYAPYLAKDYKHALVLVDENGIKKQTVEYDELPGLTQLNDVKVFADSKLFLASNLGIHVFDARHKTFTVSIKIPHAFYLNLLSGNRMAVSFIGRDMKLFSLSEKGQLRPLKNILPGIQSYYVAEDSLRARYWVGTNQGIVLLDSAFKFVRKFNIDDGMAGTNIYGILLDDAGNVWCSHQRGISSIDAKTFRIINYDKADGIQDWDFNNRAFYKSVDGTLYFGGVSGFNYFKPPLHRHEYYQPAIQVDQIIVNNAPYINDTNADYVQQINIAPGVASISLFVTIKDLSFATAREITYRLLPDDSIWKRLSNKEWLLFNNLAPGTYRLELGCFEKLNGINIAQKIISIHVEAPFYSQVWFIVLVTVLASAIIFWGLRKVKSEKQQRKLQQRNALDLQRNKITADLHDDLGSALSSLQLNSHIARQLVGKNEKAASQIIEKIEHQTQQLSDRVGDLVWSMRTGKDEFMSLSKRIQTFMSDLLGESAIRYEIDIDREIDQQLRNIGYRKNVVMIVKEAVNNAVKYSRAQNISVRMKLQDQVVKVVIKDDGIGISEPQKLSGGNGMRTMQDRVNELQGIWQFQSTPQTGTEVCFEFRLPENSDTEFDS